MDFNAVWDGLQVIIHAIITSLPISPRIWQHGCGDIYLLCNVKGEASFLRLYAETKQLLIDHIAKLFSLVQEGGDSQLIKNYYEYWTEYSAASKYLDSLYHCFNALNEKKQITRGDISSFSKKETTKDVATPLAIGELTLEVWRDGMIAPLGPKLVTLLLEAIDEDRKCQSTSLPVEAIRGTILSFVDVNIYYTTNRLKLYKELFEEPYLKASGEHFKREPFRLFVGQEVSIHIEEIIHRIEEEMSRARKFLHSSSIPEISQQIVKLLQPTSVFE